MAHIYAFGSVCRGEVTPGSDVDLLAITRGFDQRFDADQYSIYSYTRLAEIWAEGSPFAWHLSLEAKLLHAPDKSDYLGGLGIPSPYQWAARDCKKFSSLFERSVNSLRAGTNSPVFELSTIFLAVRNFATCFSLDAGAPDFSRHSALRLGENSLLIEGDVFRVLERARLLCTRGVGETVSPQQVVIAVEQLEKIQEWMQSLSLLVKKHERV